MNTPFKTVLVVDDNAVNRIILSKILSEQYLVIEAENGQAALKLLQEHSNEISAIMLDIIMPVMDGFEFLKIIGCDGIYNNLPIVVTTDRSDSDSEIKALSLGAWDFVSKPYNREIIMFRLKNAIDRSQLSALKRLEYLSEYDSLTGIYNKTKFFDATRELLETNRDNNFVFLRFDVDRFQLINSFFGSEEGDRLLKYIAERMADDAKKCEKAAYGRIESDIIALCVPYDKIKVESMVLQSKKTLAMYNPNYDIVPSIGIYVIDDISIPVEEMYNRATLAAKTCKGNYVDFYAYYNESMSASISVEQEITNDMNFALNNSQFEIYLQPKYNIHTNLPCGAEALVRWRHPKKGLLYPDDFIPVFERNGFITKLDYYVWEMACKYLNGWISQGIRPYPLSVNVSRVNIYNPNLVENLLEMVNRYNIDPTLLNLELTESAYTDNPVSMKKVMQQLQSHGFTILMDDFGSGYSSLALLKNISIDILKIDMRFLSETDVPGRGENIIASVIRMAKWLNIPVIAEGAETAEQVDFLRSVGCDYVQGYFFARPMSVDDYERICVNPYSKVDALTSKGNGVFSYNDLFSCDNDTKLLFNNALQAAVIYEFADDRVELIRVNEAYYVLLGHDDMLAKTENFIDLVGDEHKNILLNAFRHCAKTQGTVECEYMRCRHDGTSVWIYTKLRYSAVVGDKYIIIGELSDITMRKELDSELQKYRAFWMLENSNSHTVLIVDDAEINRKVLKKILKNKFLFLEAENGLEAIKLLQENHYKTDLILLDISMPVMNGKEFLTYKKSIPELDSIPVIIITADDSAEQQISTFSLGANDYIVKPFIPQVVLRRVKNVLESNQLFKKMVREYNDMSEQAKMDLMTGLVNRSSAEEMMTQHLKHSKDTCAMLMLDIDNFKNVNDTFGHDYGDKVICAVADKLRLFFRKEDIIARMGGDEFAIFIENISDLDLVDKKAHQVCESMATIKIDGENADITCSVGIAVSSLRVRSFDMLYQNSDKALYNAKCHGRNTVSVYGENSDEASIIRWINDAESVFNVIDDCIYACDKDSYELIYVNDNLCKAAGVTQKECRGRKCYDILMHKTKPCEFCSAGKMSENKVYTRLFHKTDTSQVYLLRGKNINRNGIIVHLEVAVDVTKVENIDFCLREGDACAKDL